MSDEDKEGHLMSIIGSAMKCNRTLEQTIDDAVGCGFEKDNVEDTISFMCRYDLF